MGKYLLPVILAVLLFACQEELVPRDNAVYIIGPADIPEDPDWGYAQTLDSPVFISTNAIAFICLSSLKPEIERCTVFVCTANINEYGFHHINCGFERDSNLAYLDYQRLSATADGNMVLLSLIFQQKGRLYCISTESGKVDELAPPGDQIINADASISPDGEWIAYTDIDGLWKMLKKGNQAQLLVPVDHDTSQFTSYPSWSPDCSKICFNLEEYNQDEDRVYDWICLVSADGGEVEKIVCGGTEPAFSPDGENITFVSQREFWGDKAIFTVPVNGGAPQKITYPPDYDYSYPENPVLGDSVPVYSPDGETIVFRSDVRAEPEYCEGASLWKINPE